MTKYFVDAQGNYIGGFDGAEPPADAIEVPYAPDHASHIWDGNKYIEPSEKSLARLTAAVDKLLNDTAKSYGYDSIRSMVSYKDDPNPKFDQEGTAAKFWRSAVFTYCIAVIEAVQAGTRDIPTEEELIAELPPFIDFMQ